MLLELKYKKQKRSWGKAMYSNVIRALQNKFGLSGVEIALAACLVSIVFFGLIDLLKMVGGLS